MHQTNRRASVIETETLARQGTAVDFSVQIGEALGELDFVAVN